MVTLSPASVVVIPFPYSDLSGTKLRPAVVLADVGRGDWLLCQVTSNSFSDLDAVRITSAELTLGALSEVSFARPMKLFTASESLIVKRVAILDDKTFKGVLNATIRLLRKNLPI